MTGAARSLDVAETSQRWRLTREEVHGRDGVQRHEDRADQEQEGLVLAKVEQSGQQGRCYSDDQRHNPSVQPRQDVVHRHGRRVDVGERFIHLVDEQDRDRDGTGREGDQCGDHIARAERDDREDAEGVIGDGGEAVAQRAPQKAAFRVRECRL